MSNNDHARQMEIRKGDSDDPSTADEYGNYQRILTVSLFKLEPGSINIAVDLIDADGHTAGGAGINITLEDLESILQFACANRYDS